MSFGWTLEGLMSFMKIPTQSKEMSVCPVTLKTSSLLSQCLPEALLLMKDIFLDQKKKKKKLIVGIFNTYNVGLCIVTEVTSTGFHH